MSQNKTFYFDKDILNANWSFNYFKAFISIISIHEKKKKKIAPPIDKIVLINQSNAKTITKMSKWWKENKSNDFKQFLKLLNIAKDIIYLTVWL